VLLRIDLFCVNVSEGSGFGKWCCMKNRRGMGRGSLQLGCNCAAGASPVHRRDHESNSVDGFRVISGVTSEGQSAQNHNIARAGGTPWIAFPREPGR
jgi:hypothetical protein